MIEKAFFLRELFHLAFLRNLAARLAGRPYAVKGGICLRFFHRSPRLSEDMDMDVSSRIPVKTLQGNVDAVLQQGAWRASLKVHGVERFELSKPKQTETTQRWKIGLILSGGERLSTRLEFSRRRDAFNSEQGIPDSSLLRAAAMPPFVASFYGVASMVEQKIFAIASPTRTAARDLFDLHHLFTQTNVNINLLKCGMDKSLVQGALQKAASFELRDFRDQVMPFLPGDLAEHYRTETAFTGLRRQVEDRLRELMA